MSEVESKNFGVFLVGVFLVSLSALGFEVALSFEFAYLFWFYLSFIVIAVALFGIGVGGVVGYFLRERFRNSYFSLLYYSSLGAGFSMVISLFFIGYVGRAFPDIQIGGGYIGFVLPLLLTLGSAVLPFVFIGVVLSAALNHPSARGRGVSKVYLADLVGAGVGAFIITTMLPFTSVEEVILLCGALSIVASFFLVPSVKKAQFSVSALALVFVGMILVWGAVPSPLPMGGKFLSDAVNAGAVVLDSRWTSVSRVDVIGYPNGLRRFVENGEYPITISNGDYQGLTMGRDPRWLMFYKSPKSMLAIGSGGGVELTMALSKGVEFIRAVEISPFIVSYMKNEMANYSNNLYFHPALQTVVDDGRTYIHRSPESYDLIENGVLGSAGLVVPSTAMLTTKDMSVYTVEANQEYIRHLTDGGVAVTIVYGLLDDFNLVDRERGVTALSLKQYTTLREALTREGLDPEKHFLIFRFVQEAGNLQGGLAQAEYAFLFKRPLDRAEVEELVDAAAEYELEVLYAPYLEEGLLKEALDSLPPNRDVSPAIDDRPFFYFTDRSLGVILLGVIGFIMFLTFIFIILPIALHQKMDLDRSTSAMLAYFMALGVGYILFETALIQRLILFLGRPAYAFQLVLFTMLISSGLGSLASGSLIKEGAQVKRSLYYILPFIALLIIGYSYGAYGFLMRYIHLGLPLKVIITLGLISLPAFIMGMPFPLGLRLVSEGRSRNVMWMYGVNSSGSVMASMIGMYVTLLYGISTSVLLAGVMYLGALAFLSLTRRSFA